MKLTIETAVAINNPKSRVRLAGALSCTEAWIIKLIKANKPNGPLTTAAALRVIRDITGMDESEILTEEDLQASTAKVLRQSA